MYYFYFNRLLQCWTCCYLYLAVLPEYSYVPLSTGPLLHTSSKTGHPLQAAFQSRADWWKALLVVHLWTQQETGKTTFDVILYHSLSEKHILRIFSSHLRLFSRSAMDPTNLKPRACSRCASSQTKTPRFGCVVASTRTTLLTVMAHTSRTSSCLLLYTNKPTLEKEGGEVFELKIDVASAFLYATALHTMKAAHVNRSTMTGVLSSADKHWGAMKSPCLLSFSREAQCCINYTVEWYDGVHGGVFTSGDFTKLFIVRLLKYLVSLGHYGRSCKWINHIESP